MGDAESLPPFALGAPLDGASAASSQPEVERVRPAPLSMPELVEPAHGGMIYRGGLTAAQRPGHTTAEHSRRVRNGLAFASKMRRLADGAATARALRSILCDPDHDQFMRAVEFVVERGYGKVSQKVEQSGTVRHAVVLLPAMDSPPPAQPIAVAHGAPVLPAPTAPATALPTAGQQEGGTPDGYLADSEPSGHDDRQPTSGDSSGLSGQPLQ